MENMNSVDWKERELELESALSDKFRRVWLQYSRLASVCITLFPVNPNESYRIVIKHKIQDWSLENLKSIVLSQI
jgi:hypothetical protein